ncbi:hypothetical protein Q31b_18930 [Novipirellula aureliae]|uniref:DUF218 domain-containing protein n=1 Tax=Novipirellula aureliae TaxID=2527966 RepID=A0A5C6E8Z4_9BACT|nr:YdcF family protein [Novipirellula aureliae]TWU44357.1 hypothetical protein Q31b_18930 [Novipirellula aureliae]
MNHENIRPNYSAVRRSNPWRRRCFLVLLCWIATTVLMSLPVVRSIVAYPLQVHNGDASGDAAYVMADRHAYWERLHAASDLYHLKRIPEIILLNETETSSYNFVENQSETRVERAIGYLGWLGVPPEKISLIEPQENAWFGSLSEARAVAEKYPDLERIVVVTSAAHTRRSQLCFRRATGKTDVQIYAASPLKMSAEIDAPIWIEYIKLIVYAVVA